MLPAPTPADVLGNALVPGQPSLERLPSLEKGDVFVRAETACDVRRWSGPSDTLQYVIKEREPWIFK